MNELQALSNFEMSSGRAGFPTEFRNMERSGVNLLTINSANGMYNIGRFSDVVGALGPEFVLVFNDSLTVRSSFIGYNEDSKSIVKFNLGYTRNGTMMIEIRDGNSKLDSGSRLRLMDGSWIELVDRRRDFPRYWIISTSKDFNIDLIRKSGEYITYGHMPVKFGDDIYAGVYAAKPGSVEYPSASRPFTQELINKLKNKGVGIERVTLHCNLSSLDASEFSESASLLEEYYEVEDEVAGFLNSAVDEGKKIIAVGTSVVRALESSRNAHGFKGFSGFTDLFVRPERKLHLDGIITGMHDPTTSHLLMLGAFTDLSLIRSAYQTAQEYGFLWHEFGDSCLILTR